MWHFQENLRPVLEGYYTMPRPLLAICHLVNTRITLAWFQDKSHQCKWKSPLTATGTQSTLFSIGSVLHYTIICSFGFKQPAWQLLLVHLQSLIEATFMVVPLVPLMHQKCCSSHVSGRTQDGCTLISTPSPHRGYSVQQRRTSSTVGHMT